MTEQEWLTATDSKPMLEYLRGKASDRKVRLLLCGWSRLNWKWLPQQGRSAVEVAELFADGLASDEARRSADVELWWAAQGRHNPIRHWQARLTLVGAVDLWPAAQSAASVNPQVKDRQITILRDIFGPLPFRPVIVQPSWRTPAVVTLAGAIYDERSFDRLPVLADALIEAGCTDPDLLGHLRSAGPHVKGCWAVDIILGRG